MKTSHLSILATVLIATFCLTAAAQTPLPTQPVIGGVVNGRALTLPVPEYPEAARKAGIGGPVSIQVLIDETGNVISAKTVGGTANLSLRAAAEKAAMKAIFSPTLLSGQPVKVSGIITYNFNVPTIPIRPPQRSNEDRLEALSVAAFLVVVGSSASDLDRVKQAFGEKELIKDDLDQFPHFQAELQPLLSLETMPVGQRLEALTKALSSIRSRLSESDKWQFEIGKNLGEILGPFLLMMASGVDHPDLSRMPDAQIKINLNKIRELTLSAPPEFPADVLQKLKALADLASRKSFTTREDSKDLFDKIDALIEVISPDDTK